MLSYGHLYVLAADASSSAQPTHRQLPVSAQPCGVWRLCRNPRVEEVKSATSRRHSMLPAVALEALKAHHLRQAEEQDFLGESWPNSGLVFTPERRTPLESRNAARLFQRMRQKAGRPYRRFYDLRYTCATLLLVQGVHPRVVMEILGHSQISLTMNTYSHVVPTLQQEAARRMDEALSRERQLPHENRSDRT